MPNKQVLCFKINYQEYTEFIATNFKAKETELFEVFWKQVIDTLIAFDCKEHSYHH